MESFGALLRSQRLRAGLSQNALARAAGVNPSYVHQTETGKRGKSGSVYAPRAPIVLAYANALGLDPGETDRFLVAAGFAPLQDWQTRAEAAEAKLDLIRQTFDLPADLLVFPMRRIG